VNLSFETDKKGCRLFVMNELGGSIFNQAIISGEMAESPSGWQKIDAPSEFYSNAHSLAFTMVERDVPDNVKSKLYWGRELVSGHYCWAGFESEITCASLKFENYRYSIKFREVAKCE
jgi:hypothetical protein